MPGLEAGLDVAIEAYSDTLASRISAAADRGEVLRYVAEITPERVRVGLREVPAAGPIGGLRGPDNILVFQTARYHDYPAGDSRARRRGRSHERGGVGRHPEDRPGSPLAGC